MLVDPKEPHIRPDVRRIDAYNEGEVAHQLDAEGAGLAARVAPLKVELPLRPFRPQDRVVLLPAGFVERVRVSIARAARPIEPGLAELGMPHAEQRIVVQPVAVGLDESGELPCPCGIARPLLAPEALEGQRKEW